MESEKKIKLQNLEGIAKNIKHDAFISSIQQLRLKTFRNKIH